MDEDDLMWVLYEKKVLLLLKQLQEKFRSKTPRCIKLRHFSKIEKDALMHREGRKG